MFEEAAPDAPAVIIVEDDLIFSPDFLDFFEAFSPALAIDPTLWLISAWNDNGFESKVSGAASNLGHVRRTEFFPGLGWLLPKAIWVNELSTTWPGTHWDHWLRSEKRHKYREVLYPEVCRSFHAGKIGTFMDSHTHDLYFADIAYNRDDKWRWRDPVVADGLYQIKSENYENYVRDKIKSSKCVNDVEVTQPCVTCIYIYIYIIVSVFTELLYSISVF